jgi:hypothetical protein
MSGLSALPGLDVHRIIPEDQSPAFDHEKAHRLVSDGYSLLASLYPAGALEWIEGNRPDISKHLKEFAANLDKAAEGDDVAAFHKALSVYVEGHKKAFRIYEARPPVIERQEGLLDGLCA